VTLALCQDTQAEAYDWPEDFFQRQHWVPRRPPPDAMELARAVMLLREAQSPMIVAGGGAIYAEAPLADFAAAYGIPVVETQAGKGALRHDHPCNLGAIGVTGTSAANKAAEAADVVLAVGTRLQDFTSGSRALFGGTLIGLNVQPFDAAKHSAVPLVGDAAVGLSALGYGLMGHRAPPEWMETVTAWRTTREADAAAELAPANTDLPSDAQVIGAVQSTATAGSVLVCAAGGLPGELHKLWQAAGPGSYHLEYGYSCMGYEIAGGLGVKLADPSRDVTVMVGDGSYLMMNSEIATSVAMGLKLTIVLLDNGGFGCIDRLQRSTGQDGFNNLVPHGVDLRAHAESLGAIAERVDSIAALEDALRRARANDRTTVITLNTDPRISTGAGGHWWDVAIPEVSQRQSVRDARAAYDAARAAQRLGD
jgi:3D-(3,5/4)-trihydroxycyclohexane-1,2-dione acylhydrolase (decyclizing)